jgi:DNA-binding NarL/FixJ family response regulator
LAEDDADFANTLRDVLEAHGYQCEHLDDGDAVKQRLRHGGWDLLLTDLDMPGNRNLEILYHAAAHDVRVPTIVITAYPSADTAIEALRLGVVDYVPKPFSYEDLLLRLGRALAPNTAAANAEARPASAPPASTPSPEPPKPSPAPAPSYDLDLIEGLSAREVEIIGALADGRRVTQIAGDLGISIHTVRNHLRSIFRKMGVHSQTELLDRVRDVARRDRPDPDPDPA